VLNHPDWNVRRTYARYERYRLLNTSRPTIARRTRQQRVRADSHFGAGMLARTGARYVAAICQTGLLLALATGFGFGFGAVVERLTSTDAAAGASVLVWTDRTRARWMELAERTDSIGDIALALQPEIPPWMVNNSSQLPLRSSAVSDGAAPNELRLFGR
jgi:hypothetical protein